MGSRYNRLSEAVLTTPTIYALSRNMKNIRIFIRKLSVFAGEIVIIFEKACFRNESYYFCCVIKTYTVIYLRLVLSDLDSSTYVSVEKKSKRQNICILNVS